MSAEQQALWQAEDNFLREKRERDKEDIDLFEQAEAEARRSATSLLPVTKATRRVSRWVYSEVSSEVWILSWCGRRAMPPFVAFLRSRVRLRFMV